MRARTEEDSGEQLDFDEEEWQQEQERLRREKLRRYEKSLTCLLKMAVRSRSGEITLGEVGRQAAENGKIRDALIPNVEIFKEIMVELIRNREMEMAVLRKERSQFIQDRQGEFQLNEMLLQLVEENPDLEAVEKIEVCRLEENAAVLFEGILSEDGERKKIRCSDVKISVKRKGGPYGI